IAGPLVVNNGCTVTYSAANQIANTASVTLNGGSTLSTSNFSDTIGALILSGSTVDSGTAVLTLNGNVTSNAAASSSYILGKLALGTLPVGSTQRTFTVNDGAVADDLIVSAPISGTVGLAKAGLGQMELPTTNAYTGLTTVSAGTLHITDAGALGGTA